MLMEFMLTCPNLRELDHCDFYDKHEAYKRIIFKREGEEISYSVTKPPPRYACLTADIDILSNSHIAEMHLTSPMELLTDFNAS
jgi:hypothetical protein